MSSSFHLTRVYGEPKRERKCKFLQELERVISLTDGPLLSIGGFNITFDPLEKKVEGYGIMLFKVDTY